MAWIEPSFSKTKVRKAGATLAAEEVDREALNRSHIILSNWRASHAYPMHAMLIHLRNKSKTVDKNAVVVQRLKRSPSIIAKLRRYPNMKLTTMQDIGGCRSVVATVRRAERLSDAIIGSRTSHILEKVDDYIKTPKSSGYRGIHLVYRYNASKEAYRGHLIEIQLRSKVQHAWATAVEIVGNFTGQALKASTGDEKWLRFFQVVSAKFAGLEKRPIGDHTLDANTHLEMGHLLDELNAFERLNAFRFSAKFIEEERKTGSDYFLIRVDYLSRKIFVERYAPGDLARATADYAEAEKDIRGDVSHDVVLVSGESIAGVQAAYPNYFADADVFMEYVVETMV